MAVSHRGALSFGLVHIPVALYTATKEHDIQFNQLHKDDNSRIKYKKTCIHCGEEVAASDIIKGFEASPGKYVTVTDADFEKIKTEKDRALILQIWQISALSFLKKPITSSRRPVEKKLLLYCIGLCSRLTRSQLLRLF